MVHSPPNRQAALPLHLTLALMPWLSCLTALPLSKSGWRDWSMLSPGGPPQAEKLQKAWAELLGDPKLAEAAEKEARKRAALFLEGLEQYQRTRFTRDVTEPACIWRKGSTRLLRYPGRPGSPALLLIPSLINRYYILDLTQRLSFARYLQGEGFNVYAVDWGEPSAHERHYNTALYVTEVLVPMAERVRALEPSSRMIAAGYCMGGLLTLGFAQVRPDLADGAAFLATPWDFFAPDFPRFALRAEELRAVEDYIGACEFIPAETIDTLFHCANPYGFQAKLSQFSRMDKGSAATQEFLAVEHWVNDGVAMTQGVACDCLIEWTQHNSTVYAGWRVGGQAVDPAKLTMPCFVAAPKDDRIVPSSCALPLAGKLKRAELIEPKSGHVGMMVGSRRKAGLWEPFVEWASRVR